MLRTRVWSALIALPALIAAILFAPGWLFTIIIIVLAVIGLYELAAMTGAHDAASLGALVIFAIVPAAAIFLKPNVVWWIPALTFGAMTALMATVAQGGSDAAPRGVILTMLGAFWVGSLFPYFALLRNSPHDGVALTILILLLAVTSDSAAYFVGRSMGRMKLAPLVSPNKTVEGAIGGLAGCIVVGLILHGALV
ncbi:MAG: phosphatidate cytidylyltransferase, partial [Candidatus Binataceae bacterium]